MDIVAYTVAVIALIVILGGLGAQVEIETINEHRRRRRQQMRIAAYEEVERINFLYPHSIKFIKVKADVLRFRDYCQVSMGKRIPLA